MRRFLPLLFCAAAFAQPRDLQLFLLIGQSNMAGRGKIEAADREPIPRVLMLNQDLAWVPAIDPVHFDKPQIAGVGIARTFGRVLAAANPSATIGLIPAVSVAPAWSSGSPRASCTPMPCAVRASP